MTDFGQSPSLTGLQHRHGSHWVTIMVATTLALATLAVYWQVSGNDFIYYDDPGFITQNPHVKNGLSWDSIAWAFTELYADYWHPLTWLSMMLDCQLFGLWAPGHHLVSLGIHVVNTLLLFGFLRYVTGRQWLAAFVAGLFALHPLHVESVAWAAERKDVLSTMFWFGTMWSYAYYARAPGIRRYLWVVVLFALGLMAKPMLVTLPLVLLLLDYWPLNRFEITGWRIHGTERAGLQRLLLEKVPLMAMAIAAAAAIVAGQSKTAMTDLETLGLTARFANASISYWWYLSKMVWPTDLNVFYYFSRIPGLADALWPLLLLTLLIICAIILYRSHKYLIVGSLWYIITLVPVIGLVQVGSQAHADRYTYIPLIGVFVALTWLVADAAASRPFLRIAMVAGGIAVLIACGVMTYRTVGYWKDSTTLFGRALAIAPDNPRMRTALGAELSRLGDLDAAEAQFRRSLSITKTKSALCGLGHVLLQKKRPQEALACFLKALDMSPAYYDAWFYGGLTLLEMQQYTEAEAYLRKALEFRQNPRQPDALFALAVCMRQQGRFDEAIGYCQRALQMDPTMSGAQLDMGLLLLGKHRYSEAVHNFTEAIRLTPQMAQAYVGLGEALSGSGKSEEGLAAFRKAVDLAPNLAAAHLALAAALATRADYRGAVDEYTKSVAIEPDFAAWNNLGEAQENLGDLAGAEASYRKSIAMRSDCAVTHCNLGSVLSKMGQKDAAAMELKKALALDPNFADARKLLEKQSSP